MTPTTAGSHRARRRGTATIALALMVAPMLTIPAARGDTPHGQFLNWEDGSDFTTFGSNEAVTIDLGAIAPITQCSPGTKDFIYPFANAHVVPSGSVSPGERLGDVSGGVNVIAATSGGGFVGERIATTAPAGSLRGGTYAVVFDECQDGLFDGNDALFDPAFRVTLDVTPPPVPPSFSRVKRAAEREAEVFKTLQLHMGVALVLFELLEITGAAGGVQEAVLYLFAKGVKVFTDDPKKALLVTLSNMYLRYRAIAADPPDYDFERPTSLGPRTSTDPMTDDPALAAAAAFGSAVALEHAAAEALLRSVERYQGAGLERDGAWALVHARGTTAHARLLAERVERTAAAVAALRAQIQSHPALDGPRVERLQQLHARITTEGFSADERREAANLGADANLADMMAFLRGLAPAAFSRTGLMSALDAVAAEASETATALRAFADEMHEVASTLAANEDVTDDQPVADAGGPYATAAGAPVTLDARSSTAHAPIASYEWDLDGDGAFDDASGSTVTFTPARSGDHLPGVQVRDAAGRLGTDVAVVTVTAGNRAPMITETSPAVPVALVPAGVLQMSADASDPDGDQLSFTWTVDGAHASTGRSFTLDAPAATTRSVAVTARDRHGSARHTWLIAGVSPDADGDGWRTDDCDDSDAQVHPLAPDPLNGVDDDCDPRTPDGGVPPTVDAGGKRFGVAGEHLRGLPTFMHTALSERSFRATIDWGDGTVEPAPVDPYFTGGGSPTVIADHVYATAGTFEMTVCVITNLEERACDTSVNEIGPAAHAIVATAGDPTPEGAPAELSATLTGATDAVADWGDGAPRDRMAPIAEGPDLVPYRSPGWRTQVVPHGELAGFEDPSFDDGAFERGSAPYGSCFGNDRWAVNTDLLARRVVMLPTVVPLTVHVAIDNDVQLFVNGTDVSGGMQPTEGCASLDKISFAIPASVLQPGQNLLAFRARDRGGATGFDARISSGARITAATHPYGDDGTMPARACTVAPEAETETVCAGAPIEVTNVAPVVKAGRDLVVNERAEVYASFTDPGWLDTHTATVDWGDGAPVQDVEVTEADGSGSLTAAHSFAPGTYTAEVCVTDDDGGRSCDAVRITATAPAAPVLTVADTTGEEGRPAPLPFAGEDRNPDDSFTATVTWGDGSAPETVEPPNVAGGFAGGTIAHAYPDDGVYTFSLRLCDQTGRCDTRDGRATIANVAPTAMDDAVTTAEDTIATIDVTANDSDVTADLPLLVTALGDAAHGDVGLAAGAVVYTPRPDFHGTDTFTYTIADDAGATSTANVTVTVAPVNDAPVGVDDAGATTEDAAASLHVVLANDLDVDGDTLRLGAIASPPSFGTATIAGDKISYRPAKDACGTDSLTYRVDDPDGLSGSAVLQIAVACVNDRPVSNDDAYDVGRYTSVTGNVLENDTDVEDARPVLTRIVRQPADGTLTANDDGSFVYTPDPAWFEGSDRFVYEACDTEGACDVATAFIAELGCGEDGFAIFEGTALEGTASRAIHEDVEPRVAQHGGADAAEVVHTLTCDVIVPVEDLAGEKP